MTLLNPALDAAALASEYARDDRVRIADVLDADVAARIRAACLEDMPWEYLTHVDGRNLAIPAAEFEGMPPEQAQQFHYQIGRAAADGVGFLYCGYKIDRKQPDSGNANLEFLHGVFDYLNSEEMLALIRQITGHSDIRSADAQYTRYTPGQFLTRHRDDHASEGRRVAYVLGFSQHWHPDWGGLLQFFSDDGTARDAWTPAFNTMALFDIRHVHSVTYVTPFAKQPRLSLTGWFRTKELSLKDSG